MQVIQVVAPGLDLGHVLPGAMVTEHPPGHGLPVARVVLRQRTTIARPIVVGGDAQGEASYSPWIM